MCGMMCVCGWRLGFVVVACACVALDDLVRAGIIFSEKLKHGTCPWEGKGERRTLFYK